jgi:hypothetical protein
MAMVCAFLCRSRAFPFGRHLLRLWSYFSPHEHRWPCCRAPWTKVLLCACVRGPWHNLALQLAGTCCLPPIPANVCVTCKLRDSRKKKVMVEPGASSVLQVTTALQSRKCATTGSAFRFGCGRTHASLSAPILLLLFLLLGATKAEPTSGKRVCTCCACLHAIATFAESDGVNVTP